MQRREFSKILLSSALTCSTLAYAKTEQFEEGTDYLKLSQLVDTGVAPGQIEVIEFFWYGCPHCFAFESKLEPWVRARQGQKNWVFTRVPVAFQPSFAVHQRLFYTLLEMGEVGRLHEKVFNAIHKQNNPLSSEAEVVQWAQANGLPVTRFKQIFSSFSVMRQVQRATALQNAFGVSGVPCFGVGGRFYTDASMTHSMDKMLAVADYLVAQIRGGRA